MTGTTGLRNPKNTGVCETSMKSQPANVRLWLATVILTVILSIPRFAHTTPDSIHYVNLARYFQGTESRERLQGPHAFRVVVPILAAFLPLESPATGIALISVAATIAAYFVSIAYMKRLGMPPSLVRLGTLVFVISFPTLNYASGVLTDPAGFLAFILGCYLLLRRKYVLVSVATCVGVLIRESLLAVVLIAMMELLIGYCCQFGEKRLWKPMALKLIVVALPAIAAFLAIRLIAFPDIRDVFVWEFSLEGIIGNIARSRDGWLTLPLTLGPPLVLLAYGIYHNGWQDVMKLPASSKINLLSVAVVSVFYLLYSNGTPVAYLSGRFAWPLYVALIPVAVLTIQRTPLFTKWLEPLLAKTLAVQVDP